MKRQPSIKGFSLAELLLGMGLFALLVTSVATLSIDAIRAVRNSSSKVLAAQRIQEYSNAIVMNKDLLWSSLVTNTDGAQKSLLYSSNSYQLQNGSSTTDGVTVSVVINNASRDGSGNIVASGGTVDLHTRAVVVAATWTDFLGINNSLSNTLYLSDWNTLKITRTTEAEFDQGTYNAAVSTNTSGGEVTMETVSYADWCNPSLTMTNHNISNTWFTNVMTASTGNAVLGAGSNANNETFINLGITHSDPPVLNVLGTYNSSNVANDVVKDSSYVYVATDTDASEVVIVQTTSSPYSSVGTFNAPGTTDANAIAISGNVGLVTTGSTLYLFDITSKTGSRTQLSSLALGGTASKIFVRGTYAYITLTGTSSREMVLVNIANPASPQLTGIVNVSANNGVSVYVNEAGTRAYMVTFAIFNSHNFHVIDVSNKSGTRGSMGQYSTGGMIPIDVVAPEGSDRAIIVGLLGSEQYQVVTLANETNPQYCGGLSISWSVNSIAFIRESNGDVYTYVLTADTSREFRIIKGGIGGGNSQGYGYGPTGEYTSPVFDTTSITSKFYTFEPKGLVPANTTMRFQVRASQLSAMTGALWVGPDGTPATYFTGTSVFSLPVTLSNNRYIQYRVYFTSSDTVSTAYLSSIDFTYQDSTRKLRGFTLIETILYLALFNIIFFAVITWGITLTQSNRNAEYKNAVEKNAIFLSEHLSDTFKRGISVDSVNSTFNVSTGKVRVNLASGFLEYENINNKVVVKNGTTTIDLTDRFVHVTNFTVSPVIVPPNTIIGANVAITITAEKFPTQTKTIQSYYAFR